jgi:PBSX family phage portal protein
MNTVAPQRRIRRSVRSEPQAVQAHSTIISVKRADHSTSRQSVYQDEFELATGLNGVLLPPPFSPQSLFDFIDHSNMLKQCIAAWVTNTVSTGWEIGPSSKKMEMDSDEVEELQSFIDFANGDESLSTVLKLAVAHKESVGFGFVEVIRDAKQDISLLRHASSLYMRLAHKHPQEVLVKYDIKRGPRTTVVREFKKFRRFLQVIGGHRTWFKEFGDPRQLNSITGYFEGEQGFTPDSPATEIIHLRIASNDPYGVPRWINQLPNIIGSREAEEVNMRYFEDNTVPPAMLTVAGGRLTKQSYDDLTRLLAGAGLGKERQNQMIVVEAVGESDSLDGKGSSIQLKVERLTDQRPSDGLFKDYDEGNQAKVRSSFRLPSVAVGMANEHNFATANVAMFAAESQVFAPERAEIDELLNNRLVFSRVGLRLRTVKLLSRTPPITSPEGLVKTLTALNVIGAVTPRSAQIVANSMMQIELPLYPEKGEDGYEEWMDKPLVLTTGAAKNHDDQASKSDEVKATEKDGDAGMKQPENGKQ